MRSSQRARLTIFLAATAFVSSGCDKQGATPATSAAQSPARTSSPAYLAPLWTILDQKSPPGADPRSEYGRVTREAVEWLARHPSEATRTLAYLDTAAGRKDEGSSGVLPHLLFLAFLEKDDRVSLTRLLSIAPMEITGPDGFYIEYALVWPHTPRPITNILILFDAYDQAADPKIKETLIASIRRAFCDRIRPWETDSEVLLAQRKDFEREAYRLKANKEWDLAYSPGFFGSTNFVPPPLFIEKDGPEAVKGTILP
jgi:hypothetical protein